LARWLVGSGLILTNHHVVKGNATVTVRQGQTESGTFTATVVATDSPRGIALLRFSERDAALPTLTEVLDLDDLSIEDIAMPLMALGFSGTDVKPDGSGGVSPANIGSLSQMVDFGSESFGRNLVMDVPIDHGDSGGPVIAPNGLVVGMNRAVLLRTSGGQRAVGTFDAVQAEEIRSALPALLRGESR
jgi:S1-C subfamily serine protease